MSLYHRFHDRFGTAGVVLGVIAMIIALTGSAFAAGGGLSGKQKKEVTKIAKKYAGKDGVPGAPGTAGTNGTNGKDGTNGTDGKSAETASFAGEKGSCTEGGIEVKSASPAVNVCNGAKGANGTFSTEPLPSGQSLAGVWGTSGGLGKEAADYSMVPISPAIRVSPAPIAVVQFEPGSTLGIIAEKGKFAATEEFNALCPGTPSAPTATAGHLCVYMAVAKNTTGLNISDPTLWEAANEFGVVFPCLLGAKNSYAKGSWAVKAS